MRLSHAILVASLVALPLFSEENKPESYREAKDRLDRACLENDIETAKAACGKAIQLAGDHDWQRLEATKVIVDQLTAGKDYGSVLEFGLPAITSCTNFSRAPWLIRSIFNNTAKAAIKTGKMEIFKEMTERLAREKVTSQNIACWTGSAKVLVEDALEQRTRAPGGDQQIHRTNGSTFGLWQVPLDIKGKHTADRIRLAEAEHLLLKMMPQQGLSPELLFNRDEALLDGELRAGTEEGQLAAIGRIEDFVFSFRPGTPADTNLLDRAVERLFRFHEDRLCWHDAISLAGRLAEKRADCFPKDAPELEARVIAYYFRADEEATYRELAERFAGRPMTPAVAEGYVTGAECIKRKSLNRNAGRVAAMRFLRPAYERRSEIDDDHRMKLLEHVFDGAAAQDDVLLMRSLFNEMRQISDARETQIQEGRGKRKEARAGDLQAAPKPLPRLPIAGWICGSYASAMLQELFSEDAAYGFEKQHEVNGWEHESLLLAAAARIAAGETNECVALLTPFVTNTHYKAELRTAGKVLLARAHATAVDDFVARIRSSCLSDDMRKDFLGLLKAAGYLLRADSSLEKIDYILAIQGVVEEMKYPEEKATYTARYLPKAPRSADGALRAGLFEKLPGGDVFFPYATYANIYRDKALKLLKSNPPPLLRSPDPAKSGRLAVAYDATGVHLYIMLKDPKAIDTLNGLNDGANYEITVLPGGLTHYNQVFGKTRDTENKQQVEWDAPQFGRKLTRDYIFTDSTVTEDRHVFHTFIPWVMYYTRLPEDGSTWTFVICCSWAGEFRSAGGGSVHELGRGLRVTFEIPDGARDAIRESVVKGAVGEYRRVRGKWENAEFWSDPHIGDPAFFDEVVQPLLQELDEEAERASAGELTKDETDRLFKEYLPRWVDFRLYLDDLRSAYLEKRFFHE